MSVSLRAVVDTNVSISAALLPFSIPRQVFDYLFLNGNLLVSDATLAEFAATLPRKKFDRYLPLKKRLDFYVLVAQRAELVTVTHTIRACRDPKDDKFLELAVSGNASAIVTGDSDLLALHPFRSIAILTPQDFLAQNPAIAS